MAWMSRPISGRCARRSRRRLPSGGRRASSRRAQFVPVLDGPWAWRELVPAGTTPRRSGGPASPRGACPSPGRTCPCTWRSTPSGRGAGRACPRREVGEERLVRRQRLLGARPLDGLVGHVGHEVVVRVLRHFDAAHVLVDGRRPLVRLAADEAVELVEPERVGQRSVGPEGLTSQAAVSCDLPKAAVL